MLNDLCNCYHISQYSRWDSESGDFVLKSEPECYGVKGAPTCRCNGDKSKCEYYSHPPDTEGQFHLSFRFVNYKPVSTNDSYIPTARKRKKGGKGFGGAFLRKSWELEEWQRVVRESFDKEVFYPKDYIALISSYINSQNAGAKFILKVSIPREEYWNPDREFELGRHDASNFIKAIEDSIFSNMEIDDKRTIKLEVEKGYNEDHVWYIEAHLLSTSIDNQINVETRRAMINGK